MRTLLMSMLFLCVCCSVPISGYTETNPNFIEGEWAIKEDCDELKRAIDQLQLEIDTQEKKGGESKKSQIEEKKEKVSEAEKSLEDHRFEHNYPPHNA